MITIKEVEFEQNAILDELILRMGKIDSFLHVRINLHLKNIQSLLREYDDMLNSIANNSAKWKSKINAFPRLQRERRKITSWVSVWAGKGF